MDAPRVKFSAYLDHYLDDLGPMQIVPYNKVSLNEGAVYNNSTGVFVAPVSGTYLLSLFSVASRPPGQDDLQIWISIMVNDDRYFTAMADSRGTWDDNQSSSTIILQVNESDSIYTVHYDGTTCSPTVGITCLRSLVHFSMPTFSSHVFVIICFPEQHDVTLYIMYSAPLENLTRYL